MDFTTLPKGPKILKKIKNPLPKVVRQNILKYSPYPKKMGIVVRKVWIQIYPVLEFGTLGKLRYYIYV